MRLGNKKTPNRAVKNDFLESFKDSYEDSTKDEELYAEDPNNLLVAHGTSRSIFPTNKVVSTDHISKFELETLFAIFYLQPDPYWRFLAAKELKRREWRFNKKFLIWFKRHGNPKEINQFYEKGDFLVYDCEERWATIKKADFIFEYRNLENAFE